jgi:hypothetical protein
MSKRIEFGREDDEITSVRVSALEVDRSHGSSGPSRLMTARSDQTGAERAVKSASHCFGLREPPLISEAGEKICEIFFRKSGAPALA